MYKNQEKPIIQINLDNCENDIYISNLKNIFKAIKPKNVIIDRTESMYSNEIIKYLLKSRYVENIFISANSANYIINTSESFDVIFYKVTTLYNDVGNNKCDKTEKILFLIVNLDKFITESTLNEIKEFILKLKLENTRIFLEIEYALPISYKVLEKYKLLVDALSSHCTLYFSQLFKESNTVKEHPCNAYLCSGNMCHSSKSNLPRYLYISDSGIAPYKAKTKKVEFLSNIKDAEIENIEQYINKSYLGSDEHKNFIEANKTIYENYILFPYFRILPWNLLIDIVL